MSRLPKPPLVRLLPMVKRDVETGCWNYTGYITKDGYGQFFDGVHRNAFAHRTMWEQTRGAIPPGMHLDHLCRNTRCCNPLHLEVVSRRENLIRGNGFAGTNTRAEHCPSGHPYDAENTYWRPDGKGRDCKSCRSTRSRNRGKSFRAPQELRDLRYVRGWTQEDIAEYTGISKSQVVSIERGDNVECDLEVFVLLGELLDEAEQEAVAS